MTRPCRRISLSGSYNTIHWLGSTGSQTVADGEQAAGQDGAVQCGRSIAAAGSDRVRAGRLCPGRPVLSPHKLPAVARKKKKRTQRPQRARRAQRTRRDQGKKRRHDCAVLQAFTLLSFLCVLCELCGLCVPLSFLPDVPPAHKKSPGRHDVSRVLSHRVAGACSAMGKAISLDRPLPGGSSPNGESGLPAAVGPSQALAAAWPCTRWGLPCRPTRAGRGALLPHLFTLTRRTRRRAVCFLWHFPVPGGKAARQVDVIHHRGLEVLGLSSPWQGAAFLMPAENYYTA